MGVQVLRRVKVLCWKKPLKHLVFIGIKAWKHQSDWAKFSWYWNFVQINNRVIHQCVFTIDSKKTSLYFSLSCSCYLFHFSLNWVVLYCPYNNANSYTIFGSIHASLSATVMWPGNDIAITWNFNLCLNELPCLGQSNFNRSCAFSLNFFWTSKK